MKKNLGRILTTMGAVIGVLGVGAMAIRLKIVLTPDMQQVLFYKGLFVASAVLLVLGAIYGRQARIEQREDEEDPTSSRSSGFLTSSHGSDALPGHYSTSVRENPERQYERRDRENP